MRLLRTAPPTYTAKLPPSGRREAMRLITVLAPMLIACLPVAAEAAPASRPLSGPLDIGILQFATMLPWSGSDPEVQGIYLLCDKAQCSLTLTRTFARSCTGAAHREPTMIAQSEFSSQAGDLTVKQLSSNSVLVEFTWTSGGVVVAKTTMAVTYTLDSPTGPLHTLKPVTAVSGQAVITDTLAKTPPKSYDYVLLSGPVSCDIVFSY
jgi:hypothetical protein